jgi:hypothetical protein
LKKFDQKAFCYQKRIKESLKISVKKELKKY